MTTTNKQKPDNESQDVVPRVEEFLRAVESKTNNEVHRRILRACRGTDPTTSMEAELKRVIEEIFHEA
jgi:hypothetical protein